MFWLAMIIVGAALVYLWMNGHSAALGGLDSDALSMLVVFTLIGVIGVSIHVARRKDLDAMFRQGAIWMGALVTLMIGFEYRYELQGFAGLSSSPTQIGASVENTNDNPIRVDLRRQGDSFYTAGEVNGEYTEFLVDTGANSVVLTYETAQDAGINVDRLRFNVPVQTANGRTMSAETQLRSLNIGGIERRNVDIRVSQEGNLFTNLLGMNFINSLSGVEVTGNRMTFYD